MRRQPSALGSSLQTCTQRLYIAVPANASHCRGIIRSTHVLQPTFITTTDRMCISYSSLRRLSMMLTHQRRGHFGILHEEWRTWGSCSAFMGNSPSSSSHERGTNGLTVEMRGEERENQCFCWGKERTAFTGLCIIKQLRKLIRVWGGGMRISQLIISMATTAPVDDLREDSASKASKSF